MVDNHDTATLADSRDLTFRAIKACVALGFAASLLIAPALWAGPRSLPIVPVLDFLPVLTPPVDAILYHGLLALLVAIALIRECPRLLQLAAGITAFLCLLDQARWHAWCYQYLVSLALLGTYPGWGAKGSPERRLAVINALRLLLVCTYVWSGLHKLNWNFLHEVYPWMIGPSLGLLPGFAHPVLEASGLTVPLVELGLGIMLLFPASRRAGVLLLAGMHLFILFTLGPVAGGRDWNQVVWPWNVVMILLLFLLFWNAGCTGVRGLLAPAHGVGHQLVLLLFGFMPALNFLGLWPDYLSISLYSGKGPLAVLHLHEDALSRLPDPVRRKCVALGDGCHEIDFITWSATDLDVPCYPSIPYYLAVHRRISAILEGSGIAVRISDPPALLTGERRVSWHGSAACPRILQGRR